MEFLIIYDLAIFDFLIKVTFLKRLKLLANTQFELAELVGTIKSLGHSEALFVAKLTEEQSQGQNK